MSIQCQTKLKNKNNQTKKNDNKKVLSLLNGSSK